MTRLIALLGLLCVALPLATYLVEREGLRRDLAGLRRFRVPGDATLELAVGDHLVYGEQRTLFRGASIDGGSEQPPACRVRGPGGAHVPVMTTSTPVAYDVGPYAGALSFEFAVTRAGPHTILCWFAAAAPTSTAVFALSDHPLPGAGARDLRVALAALLPLLGLALVLRRRRRPPGRGAGGAGYPDGRAGRAAGGG